MQVMERTACAYSFNRWKRNGAQYLNELLECTVDRRANLCALVEVDRSHGTFADAFWGEFEFLGLH